MSREEGRKEGGRERWREGNKYTRLAWLRIVKVITVTVHPINNRLAVLIRGYAETRITNGLGNENRKNKKKE